MHTVVNMHKAEIRTRKRAIFTALRPHLDDAEVMEALILWETHYCDTPKFALRYFIEDFSKRIERPKEAKKLFLHLLTTMNKPEQELLPDPSAALQAYIQRRGAALTPPYAANEIEAFKVLINKWLQLEQSSAAIDVSRYVAGNLVRLNIDPELKHHVANWLADENMPIKIHSVELKDLRQIINLFYIAFCEYVGPTRADALLAEAVNRLKANGGAAFSAIFAKLL